ncbi:unnamed protein product [Cyprideis torosa]|uniref:Uncharacterized protein n=1 Tax=Cyprideis torosa TaxID=163714 RepID=A0A7R8WEN4_9CRUS|nr:unnamed protein product [Cyprideis torosa]CAG0890000.1 unnamed protein product [Cyprideis torosa]
MEKRVNGLLESVSSRIFPGVVLDGRSQSSPQQGMEVVSSLPLQMCLYFNAFFFPCWLAASLMTLFVKFPYLSEIFQPLAVAMACSVSALEVIRIYLGYSGNLSEKIPELVGFWLLTLLIELPLISFALFSSGLKTIVFERTLNAFLAVLVLLELVFGYMAIQCIAQEQMKRFHLSLKHERNEEKDKED